MQLVVLGSLAGKGGGSFDQAFAGSRKLRHVLQKKVQVLSHTRQLPLDLLLIVSDKFRVWLGNSDRF